VTCLASHHRGVAAAARAILGAAAAATVILLGHGSACAADDAGVAQGDDASEAVGAPQQSEGGSSADPGWTLTFDDEFDETSLDLCKWQLRQKWGEKVVNNEREAYVNVAQASQAFTFDNGILHVVARKQPGVYGGVTEPYTSGLLASVYNQKCGYYEARIRMPSGSGLWPAFWLLHTPAYPDIHEIDIMEWISPSPDVVLMTDHFGTSYDTNSLQSQFTFDANDFTTAFHIFGLDWEADRIVWYADGLEVGRLTAPNTLHDVEMYVIVNLAVGGDLPGTPMPNAIFPASLDVDYVRVYQRTSTNPDGLPPFGPLLSIPASASVDACPDTDAGALDGGIDEGGDATQDGNTGGPGQPRDATTGAAVESVSVRGGCDCALARSDRSSLSAFIGVLAPALTMGLRRRRRPHRRSGR
jgi:beta-glucanase (GH16 family)